MNRVLILFIVGMFLSPMMVGAIDQPDDGDPSFNFDRFVFANDRSFIEISFSDKGDGVYLAFECDVELNMHVVNSSMRLAILNNNAWDSVNNLDLLYRTEGAIKFILPYDDTFYLLFTNNEQNDSNLVGWYAADRSGPRMEIFGLENDQVFNTFDKIDVTCYFEDRFWNVTKLELYYNGIFLVQELELNQKLYNWTVRIDFSSFDNYRSEIVFRGKDTFGNVRNLSILVFINGMNDTSTSNTYKPFIGLFAILFGLFSICVIVSGINSIITYRKEGMDVLLSKKKKKKKNKKYQS